MKHRLIDLFSGAGGMTLGFTDSRFGGGFTSIWGADNDPAAVETFNENFGKHAVCADLDEWVLQDRPIPSADKSLNSRYSMIPQQTCGSILSRIIGRPATFLDVVGQEIV